MSTQITTAFTKQYQANCQLVAQQLESRARDKVTVLDMTGAEKAFAEWVGSTDPVQDSTRHGDTLYSDTPHSRRMITTLPYHLADLIDRADKAQTLIDPENPYMRAFRAGFNRKIDKIIFEALVGTAYSGKEGTVAVSFAAGQILDVQAGVTPAADTGLNVGKLILANELFNAADFPTEEEGGSDYARWMAIGPKQVSDLLNQTQVGSSDYNLIKPLVEGKVARFMGFNFVMTNQLAFYATGHRGCIAWVPAAITLGINFDITATVDRLPTKKNSTQIFMEMFLGAARTQELGVVQIPCQE